MENKDKTFLLDLARGSILAGLEGKDFIVEESKVPDELRHKGGTFVTLTINNELRGCIGHVLPIHEIYKGVVENAYAAAFEDPRFFPLKAEEFKKVEIEISILSKSREFKYKSIDFLIDYLNKNKPGVVLKKHGYQSTFLPQVWDELPNAEDFLSQLCLKAGLSSDEWLKDVDIEIYNVEKIK